MGALSRFTTYVDGNTLPAADLNGDFDRLYNALTAAAGYELSITAGGTPTITVDNTGGGVLASFKVATVEKAQVNELGQFESLIATGTAPLVVASTTEVANLNAASVGGIVSSQLVRKDAINTLTVDSSVNSFVLKSDTANQLVFHDTGYDAPPQDPDPLDGAYFRIRQSSRLLKFGVSDDSSSYDDIMRMNGATGKAQVENVFGGDDWSNVSTEDYVDGKLTTLSFGAFYEGALATGTKQPRYIVPADIENADITKVYCTYQSGTVTDDSTITLYHYNAAGAEQANAVVTLASAQATGVATATDITDMALSAGDQLAWVCSAANGHAEVSIWAQGTQEVI